MDDLRAPPFLLVLAGPSGAGKTTLARRLAERRSDVAFSVSATTRRPRRGEREGADYRFVDRAGFEALVAAGEMLEYAEVHGELYGTPRENLTAARRRGHHLLLDIDVQGARQVREAEPGALSIFLLPPSGSGIVKRLRGRGSESEDALQRRLETAEAEILAVEEFDYVLVNDDLDEATRRLVGIVDAEERHLSRLGKQAIERARSLVAEIRRALEGADS